MFKKYLKQKRNTIRIFCMILFCLKQNMGKKYFIQTPEFGCFFFERKNLEKLDTKLLYQGRRRV